MGFVAFVTEPGFMLLTLGFIMGVIAGWISLRIYQGFGMIEEKMVVKHG